MSQTKKPSNPSAFAFGYGTDNYSDIQLGMTLRDYFAAKAMQGMYSVTPAKDTSNKALESDAEVFYRVADAMLKQRELTEENK